MTALYRLKAAIALAVGRHQIFEQNQRRRR